MKYISFVIPSYNADKYLSKCVNSLLFGGEDVEIIIVNDGSKDKTLEIANDFKNKYPTIVKVIDKENGGHGSTINAGLKIATGIYFKVVDADDWVNEEAYNKVLATIKDHCAKNTMPDCYVSNFVYENLEQHLTHIDTHAKKFPKDKICTFKNIKKFKADEFLMMHNLTFKTSIMKDSKLVLPEHTFYIDNLLIYVPLYYVKTLYYINANFYRYYVGRPNQSVTFDNMTKNYKMQLRVIKEMSLWFTMDDLNKLDKKHKDFMIHDLVINHYLTLFYIAAGYNRTKKSEYNEFLELFKKQNHKLYRKIRYGTLLILPFTLIPPLRRFVIKEGYRAICKKTHWN